MRYLAVLLLILINSYNCEIVNKIWTKLAGTLINWNEYGTLIPIITGDINGNIYISGSTKDNLESQTNAGGEDIFIIKYSADGTKLWSKLIGSSGDDKSNGITIDASGNIYITGYTSGNLEGQRISTGSTIFMFIMKISGDGNILLTKLVEVPSQSYGITVDVYGNIYITGNTSGSLESQTNAGSSDIFVIKFSSNGDILWTSQSGTSNDESGYAICVDSTASNVYITGYTSGHLEKQSNSGSKDSFIMKISSADGVKVWTKLSGTLWNQGGYGISIDADNDIYVLGWTQSNLDGNTNIIY